MQNNLWRIATFYGVDALNRVLLVNFLIITGANFRRHTVRRNGLTGYLKHVIVSLFFYYSPLGMLNNLFPTGTFEPNENTTSRDCNLRSLSLQIEILKGYTIRSVGDCAGAACGKLRLCICSGIDLHRFARGR